MTPSRIHIHGMSYVSGSVRGVLKQGPGKAGPDDILVLSQPDIGALATRPAGFVVVDGAPLSHAMIGLRGAGVPTVIVSAAQAAGLDAGREVLLDGSSGVISSDILVPAVASAAVPAPAAGQPLFSADGVAVELLASVRSAADAKQARAFGARAIGLVRSEFLLPDAGDPPDVEFYQHAFSELCRAAAPLAVTIRLLDLASDKMPAWAAPVDTISGALGLQGVRLFAREPVRSVLHAQLAALESMSGDFDIRLLIPYLVRSEELRYWSDYIRERLSKPLPLGAMAETPAGVLDIANWLDIADFVSIGCNDLMQCLFAADRDRPDLREYLDPYAPLLYRLLKQAAESAGAGLQRVQLCGVLPQLPGVLPILLGLGYRTFSVDTALIPHLVQTIQATSVNAAEGLALEVCSATESKQVAEILELEVSPHKPFLAP